MELAERAFRAGYRLHSHDTIGSTNAEALARATTGDGGRLWLTARVQTAGRGRRGRAWVSPTGNLHASLLLVDPAPPALCPQLAVVAAVALFDAVAPLLPAGRRPALKWPNDLLHEGAKLAGILVEGTRTPAGRTALAVGFGVNCASHPEGLPYATTDLSTAAGRPVAPATLFAALAGTVADALDIWQGGDGFDEIRARWLARAVPVGTPLAVDRGGGRLAGTFAGLDRHGRLLLETEAGPRTIEAGDVVIDGERRPHVADLVG